MVAVLFDTNIYGKIFEDKEGRELARRIKADQTFVVRNFRLIRNELRRAPKLLPIYDQVVAKRVIDESSEVRRLSVVYFMEYKRQGGRQGQKKMRTDFKIVACASLTGCDLVFSDDEKTMKHPATRQAYRLVDLRETRRPPTFYRYSELKSRYF